MSPTPPLLSVVMPAHDVAPFVAEAVRSVLRQSHPRIELIAVDDGSADGTGERLDALAAEWEGEGRRMVVRHQARRGAAAARDAALALASGPLVAFLDADDRWAPDLAERLTRALLADPALALVFPRWRYVDAEGRPTGTVSAPPAGRVGPADLLGDNPIHSATGVTLRREAAERAGGFDHALRACIDLDFWLRAAGAQEGAIACVPEAWADYRKRPGQITADWRRMERAWRRVVEKRAEAGHALAPAALSRARARACLYWSALAYEAGEHAAARRLLAEAWRRDPRFAASDPRARAHARALAASLLPAPWHAALRARFGARAP